MRAIGYDTPGAPSVLRGYSIPKPVPLPGEVLVRVIASGLNPVDWRTRAGAPTPAAAAQIGEEGPHILGWDVSGIVEAVGPGVHVHERGDAVFGMPWFPRPGKTNAEFVTGPSRQFARKPLSVDHVTAAGVPLAGLTAWHALTEAYTIEPGDRILIHAAAGGVGHIAVQIAKAFGAYVIGTASDSKHDWLRELGADELVDHHSVAFESVIEPVDAVVDLVGGLHSDVPLRSLEVLRPGGTLIRVAPGGMPGLVEEAERRNIRITPEILVEPDGVGLMELAELIDSGAIRIRIAEVFDLDDAARAHEFGETERTGGKIVLRVAPEPV